MQRKQLLKGRIYRAGQTLIRPIDTTDSPIVAERYDLIQQRWVPGTVQPRDIDAPFQASASAVALSGYSEAINAAWKRRYNHAVLDAVNEHFGVSGSIGTRLTDERITLKMSAEEGVTVAFSTQDYNKIVGAKTVGPESSGSVTMRADYFLRWALGTLGIDSPDVADIQPLPGVDPELLDADLIRRADAAIADLRTKISAASKIQTEVYDEVRRKLVAEEEKEAEAEGRKPRYVGYSYREDPEVQAVVRERVAAAGLDVEAHLGAPFRLHEVSVADLRELGYTV